MTEGTHRVPEESSIYCRSCSSSSSLVWHRSGIQLEPVTRKPTPIRRGWVKGCNLYSCLSSQGFLLAQDTNIPFLSAVAPSLCSHLSANRQNLPPYKSKFTRFKSCLWLLEESRALKVYKVQIILKKSSLSPIFHHPLWNYSLDIDINFSFPQDPCLLLTEFLFYNLEMLPVPNIQI